MEADKMNDARLNRQSRQTIRSSDFGVREESLRESPLDKSSSREVLKNKLNGGATTSIGSGYDAKSSTSNEIVLGSTDKLEASSTETVNSIDSVDVLNRTIVVENASCSSDSIGECSLSAGRVLNSSISRRPITRTSSDNVTIDRCSLGRETLHSYVIFPSFRSSSANEIRDVRDELSEECDPRSGVRGLFFKIALAAVLGCFFLTVTAVFLAISQPAKLSSTKDTLEPLLLAVSNLSTETLDASEELVTSNLSVTTFKSTYEDYQTTPFSLNESIDGGNLFFFDTGNTNAMNQDCYYGTAQQDTATKSAKSDHVPNCTDSVAKENLRNNMLAKSNEDSEIASLRSTPSDVESSSASTWSTESRWCRYLAVTIFVGFVLAIIGASILAAYLISCKTRRIGNVSNNSTLPELFYYELIFPEVTRNKVNWNLSSKASGVITTTILAPLHSTPTTLSPVNYSENRIVSLDLSFVNAGEDFYSFSDIRLRR